MANLKIGWAQHDMTPTRPVKLFGAMHLRVSRGVTDPLSVTALALEREDEAAIFVACDLNNITAELLAETRARLKQIQPEIDGSRLILHSTHTHTSLDYYGNEPNPPEAAEAMTGAECRALVVAQAAEAAAAAWKNRAPGAVARGFGHAVVGHNRRAAYFDGSARMYGATDTPAFSQVEGYEDHGVHLLYFFDGEGRLTGVVVNLACPAQQFEAEMTVSADFWHDVRQELARRFGPGIFLLPQCAPAGDQSPWLLVYDKLEDYMRQRRGLTRRQEISRRITAVIEDVYAVVKDTASGDLPLIHHCETLELPGRVTTRADYEAAQADLQAASAQKQKGWLRERLPAVLASYAAGERKPPCPIELHVIRLGDFVLATNPFELFLDYGMRIQARSRAAQTFLIQLANGISCYLPTEKAVGKHYGAMIQDNLVGPEGGQRLVERTLEIIAELFDPNHSTQSNKTS
jgi:hypothetical protein